MPPSKKPRAKVDVDSLRHKDKRANIPTEQLRSFAADDEAQPKTMLYPRDPTLDPQLVWKGKDEQDRADLAVPVVPIYIQEKIHPQAIVEEVRRHAALATAAPEQSTLDLFSDFNGIDTFEKKVDSRARTSSADIPRGVDCTGFGRARASQGLEGTAPIRIRKW